VSVSEAQHIKDQIRDNQDNLNALPVVASCIVDNIDTSKHGWKERLKTELIGFYKKIGTTINRQGFGDVIVTPRIINNALEYVHTEGTAIAFFVAHKVIKQGIIIKQTHTGTDKDNRSQSLSTAYVPVISYFTTKLTRVQCFS